MANKMQKLIDKIEELKKLLIYMQANAKQQNTEDGKKFIEYTTKWLEDLDNSLETAIKANVVITLMDTKITQDLEKARKAVYEINELEPRH